MENSFAESDINSYCFEKHVNLQNVQASLSFLLLPKDSVHLRVEDHCIDILTESSQSSDRGKLFEKFLRHRYNLLQENMTQTAVLEHCELNLKTTTRQDNQTDIIKLGEKNVLKTTAQKSENVSLMNFIFAQGMSGELEFGEEHLKVICHLIGVDKATLQFQFSDKNKGSLASEYLLKRGEWQNIALVIKSLNEKNKSLGIPQNEVSGGTVKTETKYEIQVK